jgi:site-specific DNA-cytosine methylase
MKKEFSDVITQQMGVNFVQINSALVSAQNRVRNYWCNWAVSQPEDKGITWGMVRQDNVDEISMYYTAEAMRWISNHSHKNNKPLRVWDYGDKAQMIEASHHKKYSAQRFFGIIDRPLESIGSMRGRRLNASGEREDYNKNIPIQQYIEFRIDNKSNCLSTVQKDNVIVPFSCTRRIKADDFYFRYITPVECERLQTLPDNYTQGVSNSQRYKMLGNGWNIETIAHIFKQNQALASVTRNGKYAIRESELIKGDK